MKTILIFVSTLDGKITKGGKPHASSWSSHGDQDYNKNILNDSSLIVMGSKTFDAEIFKPSKDHRLIIITSHHDKYKKLKSWGSVNLTKNRYWN